MKTFSKFLIILLTSLSTFSISSHISFAENANNLKTGGATQGQTNNINNPILNELENIETDFGVEVGGQQGIYNTVIRIARDLKNLFFLISGIYFLIIVIRLLFSEKTEEEVSNFKKGIIWISVGIIITQIAYYFVNILFDQNITVELGSRFVDVILHPLIALLQTAASFFFLAIMIYAFFRMVSSNGDEEKIKSGKMTVLYALVGFIVVKISNELVKTIYGKTSCSSTFQSNCVNRTDLSGAANIIVKIIDWMNGFVGIIVILMIIYAGFMVLTSLGDEEKLKKAKQSIIYIAIGLFILVVNYLILTFFIIDPTTGISPIS